jgi:hypothetical protein
MGAEQEAALRRLAAWAAGQLEEVLAIDPQIAELAEHFVEKHHCLFLGRGEQYPIAMEGALKLKEISYIHAEAYPAGELKHGPLALIDEDMPVVAVAPNNALLEKLKSNLEEVRARGGQLFVFADTQVAMQEEPGITVIRLPETDDLIDPWSSPSPCSSSPTTSHPQGHRRRPAAQPGQVGHRGISASQRLGALVKDVEIPSIREHPLALAARDLADDAEPLQRLHRAGDGRIARTGVLGQRGPSGAVQKCRGGSLSLSLS